MVQKEQPGKHRARSHKRKTPAARPEEEQAPEPQPHLTDSEVDRIGKISDDALFLTRQEQACVHISMEESREKAAVRLGWTIEQVMECLRQPHVKLYAIEYREKFMAHLARKRAASLNKVGVNSTSVQERLMELAQMAPEQTKGTIDGQVKALSALANILGLTKDDPLKGKSDEELLAIVNGARDKAAGKTAIQ